MPKASCPRVRARPIAQALSRLGEDEEPARAAVKWEGRKTGPNDAGQGGTFIRAVIARNQEGPLVGIITRLARYMASPFAFLILLGYGALWYLYKPETFEWHAGATMATWFMTLVIQRAEHRDTQAIHVKLDEMLHVLGEARNELTRVDEDEPEEIEKRREEMRKND
jgi:low affinity Fe/Cu permease